MTQKEAVLKRMQIAAVGAGKIVTSWLETIAGMEEIVCEALCVRKKSVAKGEMLAEKFAVKRVYTDFLEVLRRDDIDFIYIGVSNDAHFSFARQALLSDKNVILEKPFTTTLEEAQELVAIAKERKLFLFEAIMSLYVPMLDKIKENLINIGRIRLVQSNFSQISSRYLDYLKGNIHPAFDPKMYGGALYDLNVYNLHLMVALFGEPSKSCYFANKGSNGVDTSGIVHMEYPQFVATAAAAKDAAGEDYFLIQGDKGYIRSTGALSLIPKVEIEFDNQCKTYQDSEYKKSMKYEFAAFYKMWIEEDYLACTAVMAQTIKVMRILSNLWRTL